MPVSWPLEPLKKFAVFEGRARRKEFWSFALCCLLALIAATIADVLLRLFDEPNEYGLFSGLLVLAAFMPSLSVTVRRLHDTDRRGWWTLIFLVPLVGAVVLLVFLSQDSQPGANRFGPNPKGVIGAGTPMPTIDRER